MGYALQWMRSFLFIVQMYVALAMFALWFPIALFRRDAAFAAVRAYCLWVRFSARWMIGLRTEVRGDVPADEVLVAAKHQSFLDIVLMASVLPRPKFIMKKELKWVPVLGWYAMLMGCVPVDRGRRGQAIRQMLADVRAGRQEPGQLIIYPQGTRVAPGVLLPYKQGTAALYHELGQECVPVATNVGVFWPRHGIYRRPGLAVVEFLPRLPANLPRAGFIAVLEPLIEEASDTLLAEARVIRKS